MMGSFLDMQAYVGISKHIGGLPATKALLSLCHVENAREILEVGCGIGVGPVLLARKTAAHVVAVDISEKMVEWARQRAREGRLEDRIELRVADARDLPFEAGRFDVVLCESVLGFVDDKERAVRELVRVTKLGGRVGINESLWIEGLRPETEELARDLGVELLGAAEWQALLERVGLHDLVVRLRRIDPAAEVRSRLRWIGLPAAVRGWGRALRLYLASPATREMIRSFFGGGTRSLEYTAYGLFVGRKADGGA